MSHGGNAYEHVIYVDAKRRLKLEEIRRAIELGCWTVPVASNIEVPPSPAPPPPALEPIHHRLTRLLVTVVLRRSTGRWRRLWCRGGLHGSGGWSFANSLPCLFDGLPVGFLKQIIFEVAALYAHESRHRRCILASERAFTQSHTITGPWTCIAAVYVMAAAFGTMACGHVCHLGSAFVGVVAVQGMAERNSILRVALIAFASARRS